MADVRPCWPWEARGTRAQQALGAGLGARGEFVCVTVMPGRQQRCVFLPSTGKLPRHPVIDVPRAVSRFPRLNSLPGPQNSGHIAAAILGSADGPALSGNTVRS